MPVSSTIDQPDHMPPAVGDEHVEAFPKAELAHHVVRKVAEPITHVPDNAFLFLVLDLVIRRELGAKLSDMKQHHVLHAFQGRFGERLAHDSSLAPMHSFVNGVVCVIDAFDSRERIVEIRFLESLSMAVDIVQTPVRVDRHEVRRNSHMGPVFCM